MKVAHVIGSLTPGGAEVFVKSLVIEMKQHGLDVALWVMSSSDQLNHNEAKIRFEELYIHELSANGVPVKIIGKRPKKDWFFASSRLKELYDEFKPDLIHTHLQSVSFHVARSLLRRNVKLIQTVHSPIIHYRFIERIFLSRVFCKYVAISLGVRNACIKTGVNPDKIHTILNGIDLIRFNGNNKIINKEASKILAIGSLISVKNHLNLICAFEILIKKYQNINKPLPRLMIVGDGDLRSDIQNFININELGQFVSLAGIRNDIPQLLQEADIYILPSDSEGLSISLIEAFASGTPVIATLAGSNNEIVEHERSGLLVPIADPAALAEAINCLVKDFNLRKKLSKGALDSVTDFSIKTCAKLHCELYTDNLAPE